MRIIIATFLSLCSFFNLPAQQKLGSEYIGWKNPNIELHTIGDKKQSCTIVMRADSIRVFLMDGKGTLSYCCNIPRLLNEDFLGGFFNDEKLYLFLNNGTNPGIHSFCYNFGDKNLSEHTIPFKINTKEEMIIHRLSSDHHFFYFTVSKNSAELILYKFNNENRLDTMRFKVKDDILNDITYEQKTVFSKPVLDVEKTDMEGECDIEIAKCKHKIYVRNDTLLLLLNNKKAVTEVFSFDLTSNTMSNGLIHHSTADANEGKEVFNSFLFINTGK